MRGLTLVGALLLAIIGSATGHAATEKRVALVIGVGRYQHAPALTNPANDVRLIGPALQKLDFDVQIIIDPDYETLKQALRDFGRRLEGAKVALFFYAGHGVQVSGRNYLLPVNAALAREPDLRYEAFDVQAVLDEMDTPGRVNLVFLDACRDNPLSRSLAARMGNRGSAIDRGLARIETQTGGTLIAYATAPGDVAADGDRNSPFTAALARHIATPGLDVRQMLTRVRGDVQAATSGKQRPWVNESLDADFYFVPRSVDPVAAAPDPAPRPVVPATGAANSLSSEIVFWQSIASSRDRADFEAYLQQFPQGSFVSLARVRLAAFPRLPAPVPAAEDAAWSGAERRAVQTALTALGHYRGAVNGDLASATRPAIRVWQAFVGLEDTGRLTAEQRDRIVREAEQQAALLKVDGKSPRGGLAGAVKGAAARFAHGAAFERGGRQPRDVAEAGYWYALAAADGWAAAYTNLGTLYARGEKPDLEAARRLWLAAAARGEGTALFNLGALAEKGMGGAADPGLAKRWYARGAERRHAASTAALKRLGG